MAEDKIYMDFDPNDFVIRISQTKKEIGQVNCLLVVALQMKIVYQMRTMLI